MKAAIFLHNFIARCLSALIDLIRPTLGPTIPGIYTPCIFYMDCRTYAHLTLTTRSLWIAIPLIVIRLLSCNPIIGICKISYKKFFS